MEKKSKKSINVEHGNMHGGWKKKSKSISISPRLIREMRVCLQIKVSLELHFLPRLQASLVGGSIFFTVIRNLICRITIL